MNIQGAIVLNCLHSIVKVEHPLGQDIVGPDVTEQCCLIAIFDVPDCMQSDYVRCA